jgi:hypothetical protein
VNARFTPPLGSEYNQGAYLGWESRIWKFLVNFPLMEAKHVRSFTVIALVVVVWGGLSPAVGQVTGTATCANSSEVGCVIPNLFNSDRGIRLPRGTPGEHEAHFLDSTGFTENFLSLNTAIATQLTILPIASPASGFTFSYDRAAGVHTRTAKSFGPIFTERGETIGQKKVFVGFSFQRFRFDQIDDQKLGELPAVFRHVGTGRALEDVVTSVNNVDLRLDQFTVFGTVGLTNSFDVSVAVPILDVHMSATSTALIQRLSTMNVDCPAGTTIPCHFFDPANQRGSLFNQYENGSDSSGIGDVTLRFKYGLYRGEKVAVALLTDIRLPSGNEREYLGSGATGIKPFLALSFGGGRIAPHMNIGYQWNGNSLLAGDLVAGTKGSLPNQFFYSAGTDIGIVSRLTVAVDWLGLRLFDSPRVFQTPYVAAPNITFPQLSTRIEDFSLNNIAIGAKLNLVDELLLTGNILFRADYGGMHNKPVPLIGLSYSF